MRAQPHPPSIWRVSEEGARIETAAPRRPASARLATYGQPLVGASRASPCGQPPLTLLLGKASVEEAHGSKQQDTAPDPRPSDCERHRPCTPTARARPPHRAPPVRPRQGAHWQPGQTKETDIWNPTLAREPTEKQEDSKHIFFYQNRQKTDTRKTDTKTQNRPPLP